MNELLKKLESFVRENAPVIIVNTSTDRALLCLKPEMEINNGMIFMRFDGLNENKGNSVYFKSLQGETKDTLYLENEQENVLMLQKLDPVNYRNYIRPQYANAPEISDEKGLINLIKSQK